MEVRRLVPGDEARLSAFLAAHADSSMFLRSNLRAGGLADAGQPYQGTYVGAVEGDRIHATVALNWNGLLVLQAPVHLGPLLDRLQQEATRPITGLAGPLGQVADARRLLGRGDAEIRKDSREDLFALPLDRLVVPAPLAEGIWVSRPPSADEFQTLFAWRLASVIETSAAECSASTRTDAEETIRRQAGNGMLFVLEAEGRPVSMSSYNARIPDMVQIGGVFTPHELRGRFYARACVAGSLRAARDAGVSRSVLFTPKDNASAQAAYRAIGFQVVGEYGLTVFK